MNVEEIEELYQKENESVEQKFKDLLAEKTSLNSAESFYKQKNQEIRKKYYNSLKKVLDIKTSKKINRARKEKFEHLHVEEITLSLSKAERARINLKIGLFRLKIKLKNYFDRLYYPYLCYIFLKIKYKLKSIYKVILSKTLSFIDLIKEGVKHDFSTIWEFVKNLSSKILSIRKKKEEGQPKS